MIKVTGNINPGGKLNVYNREALLEWLRVNTGKEVIVTLDVQKEKRSSPQNRYYWRVVVPYVQKGINDFGNDFTEEETHDFLKSRFNRQEVEMTEGHYIDIPRSTTKLSIAEFMTYIDAIRQFSVDMLNVYIPEPNEHFNFQKSK